MDEWNSEIKYWRSEIVSARFGLICEWELPTCEKEHMDGSCATFRIYWMKTVGLRGLPNGKPRYITLWICMVSEGSARWQLTNHYARGGHRTSPVCMISEGCPRKFLDWREDIDDTYASGFPITFPKTFFRMTFSRTTKSRKFFPRITGARKLISRKITFPNTVLPEKWNTRNWIFPKNIRSFHSPSFLLMTWKMCLINCKQYVFLSLIHISEPTRPY